VHQQDGKESYITQTNGTGGNRKMINVLSALPPSNFEMYVIAIIYITSAAKCIRILFLRYSYIQKTDERNLVITLYSDLFLHDKCSNLINFNFNRKNMLKNCS